MSMRVGFAGALVGAVLVLSVSVSAQVVPVPGTGCPGAPPVFSVGDPKIGAGIGGRPPVSFRCPPPPFCAAGAASAFFIGLCVAPPLPVPSPPACLAGCRLGCPPLATLPGPSLTLSIPPNPALVGGMFCVQCVCVGSTAAGLPCVNLTDKVNVTIQAPGC